MELLAFGDPHIKPIETAVEYSKLQIPADIDVIVSLGDVIHDTREEALDYGHEFFERLAESGRPIITVPGNHDPVEHYQELTADLPAVISAHKRIVAADTVPEPHVSSFGNYSFVGWGCEEFDQGPEIRPEDYPALSPPDAGNRRYAADQVAQQLENAIYDYFVNERREQHLLEALEIEPANQGQFIDELERTKRVYGELSSLIDDAGAPVIVLSHVPPYNTDADRHHSIGQREENIEGLHVGSIGLKLALRIHQPLVALHGHSHNQSYQVGFDEVDRPHSLNLGFQGIGRVSISQSDGSFGYNRLR